MNTPSFTTDPQRISRLTANYNAGAQREKMPCEIRERQECDLIAPSDAHVQSLFDTTAAIMKERADAAKARKEMNAAAAAQMAR